ncbi:hypothetical protein [Nocardioides sp. NPDC006273]|uniref:hypothetical protein n=1 Tax=Nocardioides sp. NPDC006273 TaxID=3155598 RepID=UPI0033B32A7E
MAVDLDWYPELAALFSRQGSLAFTHAAAVHCGEDFTPEAVAEQRPGNTSCFSLTDPALPQWAATATTGDLVIVSPGNPADDQRNIETALGDLREKFEAARFRGASVWFMSEYPLSRFPILAASSLLADAETVRLRLLREQAALEIVLPLVRDRQDAERVVAFACGSRALLDSFVAITVGEDSGNEKSRRVKSAERAVADRAWRELGPDLLALVDSWVYESRLEVLDAYDVPNDVILASLAASGLVQVGTGDRIDLLPFVNRQIWIDSLGSTVAQCVDAPDSWIRVAAELFNLERQLRVSVTDRLQSDLGEGWRTAGLGEDTAGLVELARRDGIAAATSIDHLRSPLDWMQLSELISLAEALCAERQILGLRADEWARVRSDVMHVRHRVAHMRLLRAGDLEVVRRVRRLIDLRSQT